MNRVLIVDDDELVRLTLSELLRGNGFSPSVASSGRLALEVFRKETPDAVLLDLKMPGMDGTETMKELKEINPDIPVIIVTAHGDIPTAVEMIKLGAYDFIVKPPRLDILILTLKRAIERLELERAVKRLNTACTISHEWLFGKSQVMKRVIEQIHRVAPTDFSVILQGETGTGKSTVARVIHGPSRRAEGPFVTVDIGAIPETLVESELFGHEKGAFTGADKKKKGLFETANGGTILIDELQNMSPHVQSKLLRAVEEKKIHPLGSARAVEVDVRIIAATNTDIRQAGSEREKVQGRPLLPPR